MAMTFNFLARRPKSSIFGTCLLLAVLVLVSSFQSDDLYFSIKKNLKIFGAVYEKLTLEYVEPVDPERFLRGGMEAMLKDLDPYTVFYDEATHTDIEIAQQGSIAGVGLTIGVKESRLVVLDLLPGFKGFETGLRRGDVLKSINGRSTEGLSPADVGVLLKGDAGTFVNLEVSRSGTPSPLEFTIERTRVRNQSVSYVGLVPGSENTGYIKLDRFGARSYDEIKTGLRMLMEEDGAESLILDFRGNPGGLLISAVDIVSLFTPLNEMAVSMKGKSPESVEEFRTRFNPFTTEMPLAILMDSVSASASEVVGGAIQDLDRGLIIGETSFGKGLVQRTSRLPYNTSINVTVAKYYSPSGRCIQAVTYGKNGTRIDIPDSLRSEFTTRAGRVVRDGGGIEPDVKVTRKSLSDTEKALAQRSAYRLFAAEYASRNSDIATDFQADDSVFTEFEKWVKSQNYKIESSSNRLTSSLLRSLKSQGYSNSIEKLEDLKSSIESELGDELRTNKDRIQRRLSREVLAQFHPQEKVIESELKKDELIDIAIDHLKDAKKYNGILRGEK